MNVLGKTFDIICIFQYQTTIFIAQHYQMNCDYDTKMTGLNTWFLIEIFSFYGYILAASITIFIDMTKSTMGWLDKK